MKQVVCSDATRRAIQDDLAERGMVRNCEFMYVPWRRDDSIPFADIAVETGAEASIRSTYTFLPKRARALRALGFYGVAEKADDEAGANGC